MKNLIAFSGLDGAGKSTQIELVLDFLKASNRPAVSVWSRGGYTGPFNALKSWLRTVLGRHVVPEGPGNRRSELFRRGYVTKLWLIMAILDLHLLYGIYFRLLGFTGKIVVADRYLWDTWIDFKINFPNVPFEHWFLWKSLVGMAPVPGRQFLFLVPVEESLQRSAQKQAPYQDDKGTLERRLTYYQELAERHSWTVIDGMQPVDDVAKLIRSAFVDQRGCA